MARRAALAAHGTTKTTAVRAGTTNVPLAAAYVALAASVSAAYAGYAPLLAQVMPWLIRQGHREGSDFVARRIEGAEHNETVWRARLDEVLAFLNRVR
jgi:hypothetical protein